MLFCMQLKAAFNKLYLCALFHLFVVAIYAFVRETDK